jgi:hypothetical protein
VPRDGFYVGRARLNPSLDLFYVSAEGALLDTADPVEDRYVEIRPQTAFEAPLGNGVARGSYQARIRRGSTFDLVDSSVTHLADFAVDVPLGGVEVTGTEHYARGILETSEVDPGREYFFRLGRFRRHRQGLAVRLLPGGSLDASVGATNDAVHVDERAAFFDYTQQSLVGQLGYEVRPALRASLGYSYTRIPFTAERPEAEWSMHSVFGELRGEVLPMTQGNVSVGYTSQTSPNAGPGGTRFTGLTGIVGLEKAFTPGSRLGVTATRATHASNFENNGFYVTTAGEVLLRVGLPASVAVQAGAGYHRNDYRTIASSIGAPRQDTIRGWTVGLARPATRFAFVRADYRHERRDSNIDLFDSRTNVLTVQLGLGLFADRR